MRYTSSHPHAFRNRIAKSIGVLVAAALIATGAAECRAGADHPEQTASPTTDGDGFKISWETQASRSTTRSTNRLMDITNLTTGS